MRVLISVYVSGWSARVKPLGIDSPFPRAIGPPSHKTYRHITEWARLPATENPARHRRARPSGNLPPPGAAKPFLRRPPPLIMSKTPIHVRRSEEALQSWLTRGRNPRALIGLLASVLLVHWRLGQAAEEEGCDVAPRAVSFTTFE